jgi:hypothetical protein
MASRHGNGAELDVEPTTEEELATQAATDSETEDVAGTTVTNEDGTVAAKPAKESKSTRPAISDGYVSPIGFQKALLEERQVDIRPQQVYSYIRNASKEHPFPAEVIDGRPQIKVADGLAWWDAKEQRKTDRETAKTEKAAKDAAKAAAKPVVETEAATEQGEPAEEAE